MTITLPLTLPGIIVGTVLAFARLVRGVWRDHHHVRLQYSRRNAHPAFGDVHLDPDPGREGAAARLCLIAIGLALVSLLISEWLARVSRQRMGG